MHPGFPKAAYAWTGGRGIETVCNTPEELKQFQDAYGGVSVQTCSLFALAERRM